MPGTIGNTLRDARLVKGHSVADVARLTHITEAQILALEGEDFSGFPNLAYARSFLGIYSGFLGVDASGVLAEMARPGGNGADAPGASGARKIDLTPRDAVIPIVKGLPVVRRRTVKSVLLPLLVLIAILLLPTAFFLGKRVGEAGSGVLRPVTGGFDAVPRPDDAPVERPDPIRERQPSDGTLPGQVLRAVAPDPELDAWIGAAPASVR